MRMTFKTFRSESGDDKMDVLFILTIRYQFKNKYTNKMWCENDKIIFLLSVIKLSIKRTHKIIQEYRTRPKNECTSSKPCGINSSSLKNVFFIIRLHHN